jgi:hypothetical protein
MDIVLIAASLLSFFVLVLGWVVLPHSSTVRAEVAPAATSEASQAVAAA